jgi:hypothetical protein
MEIGVRSKGSTVITENLIYIYNYMPMLMLVLREGFPFETDVVLCGGEETN